MRWIVAMPFVLLACNNPCERLQGVAESKARECGAEVQQDTGTDELECTDEDAQFADCMVPCYRSAPCGAFDGTDMGAATELLQCMFDCAPQAQQ